MADVSFIDEVRAHTTRQGGVCSVSHALGNMDDDLRPQVEAAMADPALEGTAIARALKVKYGIDVPSAAIQRHRRGACACG